MIIFGSGIREGIDNLKRTIQANHTALYGHTTNRTYKVIKQIIYSKRLERRPILEKVEFKTESDLPTLTKYKEEVIFVPHNRYALECITSYLSWNRYIGKEKSSSFTEHTTLDVFKYTEKYLDSLLDQIFLAEELKEKLPYSNF